MSQNPGEEPAGAQTDASGLAREKTPQRLHFCGGRAWGQQRQADEGLPLSSAGCLHLHIDSLWGRCLQNPNFIPVTSIP